MKSGNLALLRLPAIAGMLSALSLSHSAAAAGPTQVLEEIVVTAQFKSQSLQETPLAITAVDASMMETRSQTNIADVAQRAPSVQFSAGGQGGGAQTAAVNIRGVGASDFQFPNEPGVGVYIDGVYYGIALGSAFDLVDLDRVEILRGPQGTLSGKNSIGGSIKLFSRKPTESADAFIQGTVGSLSRVDLKAASNFTVAPEHVYVRLTAMDKSVNGYLNRLDYNCANNSTVAPGGAFAQPQNSCIIGTEGGQRVSAARMAARFLITDNLENNLIVDTTKDRSEASPSKAIYNQTDGGIYVTPPDSYTNYANYTGSTGLAGQYTNPAVSNVDSWGISNTLDARFGGTTALTSITAFRNVTGVSAWDADNTPWGVSNSLVGFKHRQISQEVRLSTSFKDLLELTTGVYYYKADSWQSGRIDLNQAPGLAGFDFDYNDPFNQTSKSAFLHGVWHVLPPLNVTAGVRYTKESKNYEFHRTSPTPGIPTDFRVAGLNGVTNTFSGSKWDYRIAVDYEVMPDIRPYIQVATGFKGGGINPRPYFQEQAVPFRQETSLAYELGVKSMLFDHSLRLNAAYFHNDYKNYQGLVSSCKDISPDLSFIGITDPPCSATRNVGNANINGAELEFDSKPLAGLQFDGSASYVNFRFTQVTDIYSGIVPGVTKAMFVPKWKYALGTQYDFMLANSATLTPRLDWAWQSEMESNIPNNVPGFTLGKVESRGLFNARLTYKTSDNNWQMALAVTNALAKFYYNNKYDRVVLSNNAYGMPGRPREVMLTLKRSFQ